MSKLFIKNATSQSIAFNAKVSPSTNLANHGPTGATVIIDDEITSCLAVNDTIPPVAISDKTAVFDLPDTNRYAVEINGVIIPYSFAAKDLPKCFDGTHESLIRFHDTNEKNCLNAISSAGIGVWGAEFAVQLYIDDVSVGIIDGPNVVAIADKLAEYGLDWDFNNNRVINKLPKFTRFKIRSGGGVMIGDDLGGFVDGLMLSNIDNPTLKCKAIDISDESRNTLIDIMPNADLDEYEHPKYLYAEISVCLAPVEASMISCDGATDQVTVSMALPHQGESGGAINLYNDETNELISEIQGYYLNPPDYNMADRLSSDVTYITANAEGNSTQTDYGVYRLTQQTVSYRNTTSSPVRLRFEILNSSENAFPKTTFTEETEIHQNPTFYLIEQTEDRAVYGVCLAPVQV